MGEVMIRKMELDDIADVYTVDSASFPVPWTKEIFYQEIALNSHAYYYVLLLDEHIVGYVGMWIVEDDAQITNIAILPSFRGLKLGEKLFRFSIQMAMYHGAERLSLEVRESNIVAQNMYRKFGLVPGGIRKKYYTDNKEDAIVMWVTLT
ncbi:ribosomal protein S18-alanine N-acetyltransferase [Virgibacillus soli]|uniref:[Ribosomal protein bS18]-alanine N-acetyltransferase n=1 Tax=Paracerasibacillus soli TaxID=480284 RepID=A0ABU5CVU6_9BACI|nr:ribosomal protein S18-alanine N-acetyltransferase [Virgibacillus soli]MDY0410484.1 ribosomal protein S18-alanine N-acetyltransferase [Virgibacillus soli]